jgi:hypothetical protein
MKELAESHIRQADEARDKIRSIDYTGDKVVYSESMMEELSV